MNYDLETIRSQFPALALTDKGQPRIYLDIPAGTQVPVQVIQRMSDYLIPVSYTHLTLPTIYSV